MQRHIAIIFAMVMGLTGLTSWAAPKQSPSGVAQKTAVVAEANEITFIEQAFSSARMNSPFAGLQAPQGSDDRPEVTAAAGTLLEYAKRFLGTRYRLGATGPKAFDCSGFTSYVFRHAAGMEITRSSRSQWQQGQRVSKDELQPGDLVFFSSRSSGKNNVGHVGIVSEVDPETGKCTFIHASTKHGVTYTSFPDGGYYSKHFIGAKRVLE